MGKVARELLEGSYILDPIAGPMAYVLGIFISLLMWSFGLIWLAFAFATVLHSSPFPFNMGWWGFTFPLGVYAVNTMELGVELNLMFFKVFGTVGAIRSKYECCTNTVQILSAAVLLLWALVISRTAIGAWHGKLFHAPCLQNLTFKEEDETDGNNDHHRA